MKKIIFVFLLFFAVSLFASQQLTYNSDGLYVNSVEKALHLDEEDIDLATAVLLVSKRWDPSIRLESYRDRIDPLSNSHKTIEIINKLLFDEIGFSPVANADDPQDLFLSSVLDNKRGYCLSLSILYLSVGERLGLPLHGVVVPGHFFVRYADKGRTFNIETTQKGVSPSDEHYIKEFKIPQDKEQVVYMRNLGKKETIGCFFNNLANVYFSLNNVENAYYYQQKAVDINPMLAEARTNLGNIFLKKNMIDFAIEQYQIALKINSTDAKTYYNLASAYRKKERPDEAIKLYNIALEYDPNSIEVYKGLAQAYHSKGLTDKAIITLKKAIDVNSHDADIYTTLAGIYQDKQNYEQAILNYRLALAIKNDSVVAAYGLAYAYFQSQMYYDAIEQFKTVLFYEPDNAKAYFSLGLTYNKLGWTGDEISAYQNAVKAEPNMASAWQNLAQIYINQKQYALAVQMYQEVIKLSPSADIFYNLGVAYSSQEQYSEAEKYYSKAVELQPNYPEAHNNLAISLYMLGRYEQALKHAETAKEQGFNVSKDLLEQLYKILDVKVEN
jgi:tetratricopeptide (TPR) repeat protein